MPIDPFQKDAYPDCSIVVVGEKSMYFTQFISGTKFNYSIKKQSSVENVFWKRKNPFVENPLKVYSFDQSLQLRNLKYSTLKQNYA